MKEKVTFDIDLEPVRKTMNEYVKKKIRERLRIEYGGDFEDFGVDFPDIRFPDIEKRFDKIERKLDAIEDWIKEQDGSFMKG